MTKIRDLKGQTFGRLKVIEFAGIKRKKAAWLCECECKNTVTVIGYSLTSGNTASCGCSKREMNIKTGNETVMSRRIEKVVNADRFEGTRVGKIKSNKLRSNNKSGHTGVSWNSKSDKWVAAICLRGEKKYLGRFKKIEDAIKARKEAEEKYFKPIIEEFKKIQKEKEVI